jgi:ankyrin repeat protein
MANVNQRDRNGLTALHVAVVRKDVDTVKSLLNNFADVNCVDNEGRSPLITTLETSDDHSMLRVLLENRADPNLVSSKSTVRNSPLMISISNVNTVKLLLGFKSNIRYSDSTDRTALAYARQEGRTVVVEFLRNAHARGLRRVKFSLDERFSVSRKWRKVGEILLGALFGRD